MLLMNRQKDAEGGAFARFALDFNPAAMRLDDGFALKHADADAFFGKITPAMLAAARRLRWVQAATASLEHYMFPELVEHPAVLTKHGSRAQVCIGSQVRALDPVLLEPEAAVPLPRARQLALFG